MAMSPLRNDPPSEFVYLAIPRYDGGRHANPYTTWRPLLFLLGAHVFTLELWPVTEVIRFVTTER